MKKRLVSLLLALVMVLGMLPTVAFAADTPTTVSTEAEFVAMEAGGNYILTKDITITKPHKGDFQGHFNGNGHTITLGDGMTSGAFGIVAGPSTIENLTVAGSATGTSYLAAIAGMANAENGEIKILNCMNTANITGTGPVGGIVGSCTSSANTLTIQGCANLGNVTGSENKVGGIIGAAQYAAHKIVDCYNWGTITGFNNYAGIVGHNGGRTQGSNASPVIVQNCYSTGAVEKYGTSTNDGYAIVGGGTGLNTSNCYALTGVAEKLTNKDNTNCAFKSETDMKSKAFADLLGGSFMAKAGSYPTLAWEIPTASKTFHITPATATLTITKDGGTTAYTGTGAEQTAALPAGTYTYTVSCAGYVTKTGEAFTVSEAEANDGATLSEVTVSLDEDDSAWVNVTVTKNPASAVVTIKDAAGNAVAETNGSYKLLEDGAYTYTATTEEEGYEDAAGSVVPTAGTLTIDLPKVDSLTVDTTNAKTTYFQNEKLKTDGLVLTVHYTNADDRTIAAADFDAKGVTAAFDSTNEGTTDVTLSYKGKSVSYQVTVQSRPDVFKELRPYATITYGHNSYYKSENEEFAYDEEEGALQSKSQGMGNSQVWVSIKLNEDAPAGNVSFQYKVDSETNYDYLVLGSFTSSAAKYNKTSWTQASFSLQPGKEQLLTFRKDSSGNNGKDCVWLKDFTFERLYTIALTTVPSDASLTLKNEAGTAVSGTNGKYTVTPGTYTYEASAFGYETATGTIEVTDKDVEKTVELQQLLSQTVTFDLALPAGVEAGDYTITVKSGSTVVRTLKNEKSTLLPAGSYTYTVTYTGCYDETGSFTVENSAKTVSKQLTKLLTFADFFTGCEGVTADEGNGVAWTPVKDASGNYLKTTTQGYKYQYLNITASKNVVLSFELQPNVYGNSYGTNSVLKIKKDGETLQTFSEGSSKWQNYSVSLKTGEKLTLEYNSPSSWSAENYYVYLRNFQTVQTSKVEFTGVAEGATLTVTGADKKTYEAESGATFYLPAGTYTYTVAKYGWKTVTGSFEVKAGEEVPAIEVPTLEQLATSKITFTLTPADAELRVSHETAGTQTADADGAYTLVQGETYTYAVSKANYVTKSAAFTVSGDATIPVSLVYAGAAWDGAAKEEPTKSADGTYQISSAAELAWFADTVNNGSAAINAELTENINLNGKTWTGIGSYSYVYTGTFDGQGHMVSGLAGNKGLFDYFGAGTIKNLTVSGSISGGANMGLLADISAGTVENCFTMGSLYRTSTYGTTGGLIGRADAGTVIRNSGSAANVSCSMKAINQELNMGGLVGNTYGPIENSYATGNVTVEAGSGFKAVGGLAGQVKYGVAVKNSYAAGSVTSTADGALGAFIGMCDATISGSYYREGAAAKAVASGSATGLTAMAGDYMKSEDFIKEELGIENFHMDTDGINGGYPIHPWQGGTAVVISEEERAVTLDVQALTLHDLALAEQVAAMREQADEEVDDMLADLSLTEINNYLQDNFEYTTEFKTLEEARKIFREVYYRQIEADYLEEYGEEIDLDNTTGLLTPDNSGVYHIKSAARLDLVGTGENGSAIAWSADNDALNTQTGKVTLPASGTLTVKLTATATKGDKEKSRVITVVLYSAQAESGNVLDEIAQKLSARGAFVQPVQIRSHENVTDAVSYWLYENGYDDEGIAVELVSPGTLATSVTGDVSYIAEDGTVRYYQGEGSADTKYVTYTGVTFELSKLGATKTVTTNVRIGWDVEKAKELMQTALDEQLTWEKIRGANKNTASASTVKDFTGMIVDGQVSEMLNAPRTVSVDGVTIRVGFISLPSDAVTYEFTDSRIEISPRRPAQGKPATTFDLQMLTLFDDNLDEYTLAEMKSRDSDETSTLKLHNAFRITVKPQTQSAGNVLSENLKNILPGLVTNYYDFGAQVDLTQPVKDDLLLPDLDEMSDAGIFDYDYSQMQKFESLTPDVAEMYGYHIIVYRPLPGEPAVEAKIKVQICERVKVNGKSTPGKVLGETILTFTVAPLTQKEIDDANALMNEVTTEDFYWNAIRGKNTDKKHVTTDLDPFYKVVKNADGTYSYPTLGQVKNVEGIYTDDYPGYDPMGSYGETYRTYYSSRHTVIKYENLLLTQPDYNTEVTISSWLTYTQYAKYYEKFVENAETANDAYNQFKTFYKHKVSTTVKVDGKQDIDEPKTDPTTVDVTVVVDGRGAKDEKTGKTFTSNKDDPYQFIGTDNGEGITVANVMEQFFKDTDYTSDSYASYYGGYIAAITDPNGVTLEAATKQRPYSGWMYTRNDKYADAINAEFVEPGDEIYFYYTENYYLELDENSAEYKQYKMLADDVADKINAIPDELTEENAKAYEKAVTVARNAYNDLDEGVRAYLLEDAVKQKLFDAEEKLAAYKAGQAAPAIENVRRLIAALPDASELTPDDRAQVVKAYDAYLALTQDQRAQLTEAEQQKIRDCMAAIRAFRSEEDLLNEMHELLAQVADEKNVTASEKLLVEQAESIYNGLSAAVQEKADAADLKKIKTAKKSIAANEKAAAKVSDLIADKLTGEPEQMTLSDRKTVTSVEKAYDKLTAAQKTYITDAEKAKLDAFVAQRDYLTNHEAEIKANEKAAAAVDKQIKALPKADRIKYTDKAKIDAAREAYEALNEDQKKLVENLDTLVAAEAALSRALDDVKDEEEAAKTVTELIEALPETVVHDHDNKAHQAQINEARTAYNALEKVGRNLVSKQTLKKLTTAEKALKKLVSQDTKDQKAADKVAQKIEKLPEADAVISKNKKAIEAARKAYDKLNANAKKYADELTGKDGTLYMTKLAACEEALTLAVADEAAAKEVETLIKKLPAAKRVKEANRAKVQEAWDAYKALTEKQQKLIAAKNVQKLLDCCEALKISTEENEIDVEALALEQEETERAVADIEHFVTAEDEADDESSIEEDFEDSFDEQAE